MAIDIKNLPPAIKILLIFIAPILITPIFYLVIYSPKSETLARIERDILKLNEDININSIKATRLDELKKKNLMLQARLMELKEQLPEEKEVSSLLKEVSDLSASSGLDILYWKPGERKSNPSGLYEEIPVKVEVTGGYHDLGIFFSYISKLKRIVKISDIKMGNIKVGRGVPLIQTSFTATTFASVEVKKEEEPKKKKEEPRKK